MANITTRHIRHDWQTFVDSQEQNSVKTLCGVRSRPGLSGIPGITHQDEVVEKGGKLVWGWCQQCVRELWWYSGGEPLLETTTQEIINLHRAARDATARHASHIASRSGRQNN